MLQHQSKSRHFLRYIYRLQQNINELLFKFLVILLTMFCFAGVSYGALSARTATTIEGSRPYLLLADGVTKLTNLNELLGFTMPKRDGSEGPYTLKVEVPTAVTSTTVYGAPNSRGYGTHAGVTYTFTSNNQGICYLKPGDVTINTGTAGVNIKYAAGYNSAVWEYDSSLPTAQRHKGFKVGAGFPTTGFYKAEFSVIGSGNDQSRYRCSSPDDGGKISLSGAASATLGAKCTVTYNSATRSAFIAVGTPTIKLEYNTGGSSWVTIDSYTIPSPDKWAIGKGLIKYGNTNSLSTSTSFPALDACRLLVDGSNTPATTQAQALDMTNDGKAWRQKYLYRRDEFTNSPYADVGTYPELSAPAFVANYFSRDVDGTFMGEWGNVYNYEGSGWVAHAYYWTAEAWSTDRQFYVDRYGYVLNANTNTPSLVAVCRGE